MEEIPLVSVICTTYNHERYIKQALDGFICQKTNFPFEIIVHDDASTDGTVDILKSYEQNNLTLFRNIYRNENWYSKGKNIWKYLFQEIARGEYIAICEGDDYWIDPYKLQKEVDYMEMHSNCTMVHTDFYIYYQKMHFYKKYLVPFSDEDKPSIEDVLSLYRIQPVTALIRRSAILDVFKSDDYLFNYSPFLMGDIPLFFCLRLLGPIGVINDITSVYRIVEGSASHQRNMKQKLRFDLSSMELRYYLSRKYRMDESYILKCRKCYNHRLLKYKLWDSNYLPMFPIENLTLFDRLLLKAQDNEPFKCFFKAFFCIVSFLLEKYRMFYLFIK